MRVMKTRIAFFVFFFVLCSASCAFASDWESFGKDSRHTATTDVNFDSPRLKNTWTFTPSQHVWEYEKTSYQKGMNVWSTSCATLEIDGKKIIYVGFYDHNLYAIDASSGEYIWRHTTGGAMDASPCAKTINGQAMVFTGSGDRTVYAIDGKTGNKIWGYEIEAWDYTTSTAIPSSPILEKIDGKDTLFIGFWINNFSPFKNIQKGELFSFDALTGKLNWRAKLTTLPLGSPAFTHINNEPALFVTSQDGNLYSIDAKTGKTNWNFTSDSSVHSSPTILEVKGEKYVAFGTRLGNIYALNAASGDIFWKFKTGHAVDSTCAFSSIENRPVLFIGSHDRNLYAINATNGKKIWAFQTDNFITSSPAIGAINGKPTIFIASLDDNVYAIDALSGDKVWSHKTGKLIWEYTTRGDTLWSSPLLVKTTQGPLLIFGSYDGTMYAFK